MTLPKVRLVHDPSRARKRARQRFESSSRERGRCAAVAGVAQDVREANQARIADGREAIEPFPPPPAMIGACSQIGHFSRANRQPIVCHSVEAAVDKPLVCETDGMRFYRAYRLLDQLRNISRNSTARCRRFRIAKTVQVFADGDHVTISGVQTCHNAWGCPVCSLAIQIRRAAEIEWALDHWKGDVPDRIGPNQATAYMLSLTVRHGINHKLADTVSVVTDAWGDFFAGRAGQELHRRLGINHFVRSLEVTWSPEHGWHPHLHVVIFTNDPLRPEELEELDGRWHEAVRDTENFRKSFSPNQARGFNVKEIWKNSDGKYLQKMFLELTDVGAKEAAEGHLSYWQVAEQAAKGDPRMIRVWREAQDALFRKKQLTWSKGSKAAFGIPDLTDEMLCDEQGVDATNLAETLQIEIPGRVWDEGFRRDPLFLSTTLAAISAAARGGDYSSLLALLSERLARQGGGSDCLRETRDFCSALARQLSKSRSTGLESDGAVGAVVKALS